MITEITMPDALAPAFNQMPIVLETDNWLVSSGTISELNFRWIGGAAIGNHLIFEWNGNSVDFEFVASPDNSGQQLTAYSVGTIVAWAIAMVAEINKNYRLTQDFTIQYAGLYSGSPVIKMLAKVASPIYDLSVPSSPGFWVLHNQTAGITELKRDRFRILIAIQKEQTPGLGDYADLLRIDPAPSLSNRVEFDVARTCKGQLQASVPDYGQTVVTIQSALYADFRLQYLEQYDDPTIYTAVQVSDPWRAYYAGITPSQADNYDFPPKNQFLSHWPETLPKSVWPEQHEYLYFLLDSVITSSIHLIGEINYTDGTSVTVTLRSLIVINKEIYCFPAGFDQLSLSTITPSKTVLNYRLWLENQSSIVIADPRTYLLDRKAWPKKRQLLFVNSLGGIETLQLHGLASAEVNAEMTITERILNAASNVTDGQYSQATISAQELITARSTWHPAKVAPYWQDILLRSEAWIILSGKYLPVIIRQSSIPTEDESRLAFAIELKFSLAFNQHSYTPS